MKPALQPEATAALLLALVAANLAFWLWLGAAAHRLARRWVARRYRRELRSSRRGR